ncbi:MAG: threonine ammonia-lyase [Myxococcaceae bacterium]|nr:threonine ammonia-lyase [Myxococcaceae bacterium]
MITLQDIEEAFRRIDEAVYRTPCARSEHFKEAGCSALYNKLENLQRTGSFKERGALNKMLSLSEAERSRGVIAASAGNHAQGVAFHAGRLGIKATIVMPERTPLIKVASTRYYGARVILSGNNYDEAYAEALRIQEKEGLTFIHPFNDPAVMAGQGTIALELMEQNPYLEMVVVPIGGGGLIAGIACAIKELNPRIQVIGVQAGMIASMKASRDAGKLVDVPAASTIADGIAVKRPGDLTFGVIQRYVDDIVTVDEEEIANAILLMLEREKSVAEGAGAAPLAALINGKIPKAIGRKVALIVSGGNIDVNVISRIIERGLLKDGRLVRLVVRIADRPGMLAKLMAAIAEQGANVTEIYHNRIYSKTALGEVAVEVTLETRGRDHIAELLRVLTERGWSCEVEAGVAST